MKKVCSWCNKNLGMVNSDMDTEMIITHGLCVECANKIFNALKIKLPVFLNTLAAPVVAISQTGNVLTANRQAQSLLQKELSDIAGYTGGEVFDCAYSRLPGGCGNTIHCSGCTIRNTVMDTFQDGQSRMKSPAYLNRGAPGDPQKIALLISTEKVGDVVLLRIDKVGDDETAQ
ncbi:MAG: hypothetical protein JEZ10_03405 [Verrucomicrobia bacterium]|nr:hypothetical protein [Verrucomicrobiota bacterium]